MGIFIITKKNHDLDSISSHRLLLEHLGLSQPFIHELAEYKVYSWSKIKLNEPQFIVRNGASLFVSGTPVYKGAENISISIERIFEDLLNDNWDYRNVRGNYVFCYSPNPESIRLYVDQAGIGNLYFDKHQEYISTSFLSCIFGLDRSVTLNKNAAIEIITSGRLIGPDTLVNEIIRAELHCHNNIHGIPLILDQSLLQPSKDYKDSFEDAVDDQIREVDTYFKDISPFAKYYHVDSGITGGHDSRMILMELLKFIGHEKFQLHSFWRKTEDIELQSAKSVANASKINLRCIPIKHHFDMSEDEMYNNLKEAYFFYDGHVRMHCFYTEVYNTLRHRIEILGDKGLGLNGVGGEQYRNEWHMESKFWSMKYFIRYFLCYQISGRCFNDKDAEHSYFNYLEQKLRKRLNISVSAKRIDRQQVQKYVNEVYVTSLMGARTNAEQKLGHFLSPFLDRQLTYASYRGLIHHGVSFKFQQAMLRRMNPAISQVPSGYGYDFMQGEPILKKIKYLIKEFTPKNVYQNMLDSKFRANGNSDFEKLLTKFSIINDSVKTLRSIELPLDEKIITSRPDLMPVYVSLAYTIHSLTGLNKLKI